MKIKFTTLYLIILLSACSFHQNKQLEYALEFAEKNRQELEKTLEHYQNDPQKYNAAIFLISNMIGKYGLQSPYQDSIKNILVYALNNNQVINNTLIIESKAKKKWQSLNTIPLKRYDLQHIKADYLISNIDMAFHVWKKYPWNRSLSFEDFCEYLLPYRIGDEELTDWRDKFYKKYSPILDAYKGNDVVEACNLLIRELKKDKFFHNTDFSIPHMGGEFLFNYRLGACREGCDIGIYAMRACGIPIAIDRYIHSTVYQGSHTWNVVRDTTGHFLPFWYTVFEASRDMKDDGRRKGKVYRSFFGIQNHYTANEIQNKAIPTLFRDPFIKDVSANYFGENNVQIPIQNECDLAMLGVFSPKGWIAIDKTIVEKGVATFHNLETNIVFQPLVLQKGHIHPEGFPFVYDGKKMYYFIPDTTQWDTVPITRKFPLQPYQINYMNQNLHGAIIEGDKDIAFKHSTTLVITPDTIIGNRHSVLLNNPVKCRYIRLKAPKGKQIELAELSLYDSNNQYIPMKISHSPNPLLPLAEYKVTNLCDQNPLSYFISKDTSAMVVFDLGKEIEIAEVKYIPHNDENFVIPDDLYELYFQNGNKGWESLGMQSPDKGTLYYRVPKGALFWLKNKSKGKEEQVFFFKQKKQFFSFEINKDNEIYK